MSFKINNHYLLILAVMCIFILIPSSFALEIDENQTVDSLNVEDSTSDAMLTADENVIYVSPTAQEGDGSQDDPYNLTKAVETYDSSVNSKIIMKNGEYKFTEQLTLNKDITIEGESYNGVILNGAGESSIIKASKGNIVLSNLKFVNGYSEYTYFDNHAGGLQITYVSHILVDNCIFENNANGALSASGSNSVIDIQNSIFDSNFVEYAWSARGAAINAGAQDLKLNVVNTTFKDNYLNASLTQGAAVYGALNFESFVFDNCLFINNSAADGGSAIYSYCGGNVTVLNTKFINQTPSVILDSQRNNRYLNLFIKNVTFDQDFDDNIVVEGNVNLVSLESNDKISGNNINMNEGDDEDYTVTLTDANGKPIDGKMIVVTLTNYYNQVTTFNATTNSLGQVSFSMRNQSPGKYKVLASFDGDSEYDRVNTTNVINIASDELINLLLIPDSIKIKEGDSYIITGYITDRYFEPTNELSNSFVVVEWYNPTKHALTGAAQIEGNSFTFDIAQCSLKTNQTPYIVTFNVDPGIYEGYVSLIQANLTVDLSVDLPDVGDIDVIHVSTNGSDVSGNGSEDNPLATVQLALILNNALGGGKTIVVDEGVYDISNFNILSDVTIVGQKSKTIFRQISGRDGMFKIFEPITVNLINITLIDGYTTPMPYSLITAYGEGVVVNIDGCEFRNNTCLNGATIAISHGASVYVNGSRFIDNKCILIQSTGGAIFVLDGYLKVTNSEFINNTACDGGAIWVGYPGTADIINSTFVENVAYNTTIVLGGGGAIYTKGVTNIENSTFIRNYADLYGGAIYVAGGEATVSKSYFEDNHVGPSYDGSIKGSAIQSEPWVSFDFKLQYSVLLSDDTYNYIAYFSNSEDSEINVNYNYWGSNSWNRMNTNAVVSDYVIIKIRTDTVPVYKDDVTAVDIEFKDYDSINKAVYDLDGFVHDYTVDVSSKLNDINSTTVTIVNNIAQDEYYPNVVGTETVEAKDASLTFDVVDTTKKEVNANVTINAGNTTTIIIEVPADLMNNVSIVVKNKEYSREAGNGTIVLTLDTVPGNYEVIVSYEEDDIYKGFSKTSSFNVAKYPSSLSVFVEDIVEDQSAYVDINITDGATGDLLILINGIYKYPAAIEDGKSFKVIYDLPIGVYTVDVIYDGDDYYAGCNASTKFEVKERPVEPVEPIDGYAYISVQTGSETTITVRVPANLTENVTIKVNDDVYSKQSGDGVITLTIPTEIEGLYSVTVNYDGDETYNPFSASKMFRIYDYCWFINDTGYRTLREAVDAAGDGDVIKGNISLYETDETVDVGHRYMPSEPWEVVKNITITSMSDKPVTIKGNTHRLFYIDKDSHLTLNNLILTGSNVDILDGGAVENLYDSYVTIDNCTFTNFTADRGGALFLWGQSVVKNSVFIDNYATLGGAIFILSPVTNDNNVILDNITLIDNSAMSYGGAIYISGSFSNTTIINNSNFINNTGHGKGGAVYITYGNVIIENSLFDSNEALDYEFDNDDDLSGGAVFVSRYVDANISNTKFVNNYAQEFAGALACDNSKVGVMDLETGEETWTTYYTNVDNCSFINNTAGISAGAIYIGLNAVPTVIITDSVFDSNKAPEAAAISNNYGYVLIDGAEFTNNVASNASLITTYGTYSDDSYDAVTTISGSKFADNEVSYDVNQLNSYTILTIDDSTFDDDAVILINKGEAELANVIQSRNNNGYAVINNNSLSLSENTFINPIKNNGRILTETFIVVLDNETKSAAVNSTYDLKAVVCDDNGNIIEKGSLTFLIDDKEIVADYRNEEFVADYDVAAGSHIVDARYNGTGLVQLKVKTGILMGKISAELIISVDDINVGENATVVVNVDRQTTGNITITINNNTYEVPIKNGEAKFVIPDLKEGIYPVEIVYSGNDIYAPKTELANLTVNKVSDYEFDVDVTDVTTNSAVIEISLPEDISGDVTLNIDGNNQSVTVNDGKAVIPLSNLTIGLHDVEIIFAGDDKYSNSSVVTSFTVSKLDSFVKVSAEDIFMGEDAIINLILPDDATGDIIVTVGEKDYVTSVNEGKASVSISDLIMGYYSVDVTYVGDLKYLDSANKTSFKVLEKEEEKPVVKNTLIELSVDNTKISGILREINGNAISNALINYVIDGVESGNVTTDMKGAFSVQGVEGKKITFQYLGNDTEAGSVAVITLNNVSGTIVDPVIRKDTHIVVDATFTRVATDYFAGERGANHTAYLVDEDGNPVFNKTVQIAVNGAIYNLTTDKNGAIHLQINLNTAMIYTYALSFKGDDEYQGSPIASSKLTVTKKKTSISATKKTFKAKTKTKTISVTLKTIKNKYNGKTYLKKGKKLTLKINGKTYTAKTNAKGIAKFKIKLTKKGKYTAKIKFAGDKTYKASSKSIKVTIK